MTVDYSMVVDFVRPSKTNTIVIRRGEQGSRKAIFILMNNGQDFDMSEVTAVTIKAVNEKGSVIFSDATGGIQTKSYYDEGGHLVTENTNRVEYALPSALTSVAGRSTLSIELVGSKEEILQSFDIYVDCQNQLMDEDDYSTETDLSGFKDLLTRALATLTTAKELSERQTMPNPYPLTIMMGRDSYTYDGSKQVNIIFEDGNTMGY